MTKRNNKVFAETLKRRIYVWILKLINFTNTLTNNNSLCRTAKDQLIRSGTSVGANYIEAIAGSSKKDFANYLSHSLKSANESKFWLALLRDTNKGNKKEIENLLKELTEISNILGSSIKTLKKK